MRDDFEEIARAYLSVAEDGERKRILAKPRHRGLSVATKVFIVAAVLIVLASGALAAMVLFTQTPSYTSTAALRSACVAPTGVAAGSLITFTCTGVAPISVVSTATGFVSYSAYTVPAAVPDVYLVDTAVTTGASCAAWTSPGATNVNLAFAGGQITIGSGAGKIAPGHSYNYCADYSSAPGNFTFTITWTQG